MTGRIAWFLLLSATLVSCQRAPRPADPDAPIVVTVTVDPVQATLLDTITLHMQASADPRLRVTLPEYDTDIAGLRIVDAGREARHPTAGRHIQHHWYALQADRPGTYLIPAQRVRWQADNATPAQLSTPQITLQVLPPADNATRHMTDIHDLQPLLPPPRPTALLVAAGTLALLAVVAAAIGIRRWLTRRPGRPDPPPHQLALDRLEQLIAAALGPRDHVFQLSDILRHYLAARFPILSVEYTTEELLPCLQRITTLDDTVRQTIRQLLTTTDLVKFARYRITADETALLHTRLRHVIANTTTETGSDAAL